MTKRLGRVGRFGDVTTGSTRLTALGLFGLGGTLVASVVPRASPPALHVRIGPDGRVVEN